MTSADHRGETIVTLDVYAGLSVEHQRQAYAALYTRHNEMQTKIDELTYFVYQGWSSGPDVCQNDIEISGPKCWNIRKGVGDGWTNVYAKRSVTSFGSQNFYFEVKDEGPKKPHTMSIGLATKAVPLNDTICNYFDSYTYGRNGTLVINRQSEAGDRRIAQGDVVGCGVDLANRRVFFTNNGEHIATKNLSEEISIEALFPCISMWGSVFKFQANFGPDFNYNIANV